jgi:predicted nucleic acid-binding protein
MPGPYVVDASVFLNAFIPEDVGHETSKDVLIRMQAQGVPLVAPTLLLPEVAGAIRRGQDDSYLARSFAGALSRLPHLTLVPLDQLLAQQALDAAALYRLRGSDAVYVAVALRYACPLVTLDMEQHDRAAAALKTYYPADLAVEP